MEKYLAVILQGGRTDTAENLGSTSQNEGNSTHYFFIVVDQIVVLIIRFQLDTIAERTDLKSEVQVFTIEK